MSTCAFVSLLLLYFPSLSFFFFFFNDTATTEIYTLSLHDALPISQLAGEHQLALAAHHARLDEHDVASDRRVVHPRRDPDVVLPRHALGVHLGASDEIVDMFRVHCDALGFPSGDLAGDLAPELADLALELAHTRLARVTRDDRAQSLVRHRELLGSH